MLLLTKSKKAIFLDEKVMKSVVQEFAQSKFKEFVATLNTK